MIDVVEVGKVYGKKDQVFTALDNITFVVPDGASVAIVGNRVRAKAH